MFTFFSTVAFPYLKRNEDWTLTDSLYFTTMTFLTIGLGDLAPEPHPWGYMLLWVVFTFLGLISDAAVVAGGPLARVTPRRAAASSEPRAP